MNKSTVVEQRVAQLRASGAQQTLRGRKIGLEKESLRVGSDGGISQTSHPTSLGSALTHPHITTDYGEALLEMVTPPFTDTGDTLAFLDATHRFIYRQLGDETLWATSMPCVLDGASSIRIAEYGSSNAAQMKTAYRRGLGHRYGKTMQVIAGVHYNYSYPAEFWALLQPLFGDKGDAGQFISESYLGMVRNLQRYGWLVPYLFGASPAICQSFIGDAPSSLETLFKHTRYGRYATSLRMGDIGYQNSKEDKVGIRVDYTNLRSYIDSLSHAINTPCPNYTALGMQVDGEWQQLNANILQIENEHYSTVRPKQILQGEEKPTLALARRGVAYIELRSIDVNAFEPLGINERQLRFLEAFLLCSLLSPSPPLSADEQAEAKYNMSTVAQRGREPGLKLRRSGRDIFLCDWANEIFATMAAGCEMLDTGRSDATYCAILSQQQQKIDDPELTPSARMLAEMRDNREEFFEFALRLSTRHRAYFLERELDVATQQSFVQAASDSLQKQHEIESADEVPFEIFMQDYFNQS